MGSLTGAGSYLTITEDETYTPPGFDSFILSSCQLDQCAKRDGGWRVQADASKM